MHEDLCDLITFAGFIVLKPADIHHIFEAKYIGDDLGIGSQFKGNLPCVSLENEVQAWRHIDSLVDKTLSKYPTTHEEDSKLLEEDQV